jgi:hypothetical protein
MAENHASCTTLLPWAWAITINSSAPNDQSVNQFIGRVCSDYKGDGGGCEKYDFHTDNNTTLLL